MATIASCRVPAREFALAETFAMLPDVEFEIERIVEHTDERVMPLVWVRNVDRDALKNALDTDSSVERYTILTALDDEHLCRLEWTDRVELVSRLLVHFDATIVSGHGSGDSWYFRVLFPERSALSETHEFCREHGLTFDLQSAYDLTGGRDSRHRLTEPQYEALALAAKRGYFNVPRGSTAQQLAAELDISHQALSERLRRAYLALIEDALEIDARPSDR